MDREGPLFESALNGDDSAKIKDSNNEGQSNKKEHTSKENDQEKGVLN